MTLVLLVNSNLLNGNYQCVKRMLSQHIQLFTLSTKLWSIFPLLLSRLCTLRDVVVKWPSACSTFGTGYLLAQTWHQFYDHHSDKAWYLVHASPRYCMFRCKTIRSTELSVTPKLKRNMVFVYFFLKSVYVLTRNRWQSCSADDGRPNTVEE